MADVLRLGIVGLGMGAGRVIPEIAHLPYIKLTAGADLRPHALKQFREEFGAQGYQSVEEMCQSPDVDAVYVCTPHNYHCEHTITALKNKKHVIVEKPMALSIEECEAMNQAAEANGVKLLCGHTHSFDPPIQKMAEVIRSGQLGRTLMINSSYYRNFIYRPFSDQDVGMSRGVVLNQGPHQVDIVRLLGGGMVRSVRAMAGVGDPTRGEPRPAEGHYICISSLKMECQQVWYLAGMPTWTLPNSSGASVREDSRLIPSPSSMPISFSRKSAPDRNAKRKWRSSWNHGGMGELTLASGSVAARCGRSAAANCSTSGPAMRPNPILKQQIPLRIVDNAVRWLAGETRRDPQ